MDDLGIAANSIGNIGKEDLRDALDFSSKFCSISVQKKGAIPSYPTLDQMSIM